MREDAQHRDAQHTTSLRIALGEGDAVVQAKLIGPVIRADYQHHCWRLYDQEQGEYSGDLSEMVVEVTKRYGAAVRDGEWYVY